jgi:hypothetical protein
VAAATAPHPEPDIASAIVVVGVIADRAPGYGNLRSPALSFSKVKHLILDAYLV